MYESTTVRSSLAAWQSNDDAALDAWVRSSLKQRYAAMLHEPVPEAMADLLRTERWPARAAL